MIRRAIARDVDHATMLDPHRRRDLIGARFSAGDGWITETDDGIVAFALVSNWFYGRTFIELLVVREQNRRAGIARALVQAILGEHPGARMFSSTNESNVAMRRLLETIGFTAAGAIHGLDKGDPELVFYIDSP